MKIFSSCLIALLVLNFSSLISQNESSVKEIYKYKNIHLKANLTLKKDAILNTDNAIIQFDFSLVIANYLDLLNGKSNSHNYYYHNKKFESVIDSMKKYMLTHDTITLTSNFDGFNLIYPNCRMATSLLEKGKSIVINKENNQRVLNILGSEYKYAVSNKLVGEYGKKFYFLIPYKEFLNYIIGHY